jgi:septum formation protein
MLGFAFGIRAPDYEEINPPGMDPRRVPEHLARGKAEAVPAAPAGAVILSADTVVLLGDRILGKPRDADEALEMLNALNGRTHEVITGVAVARNGKVEASGRELTRVAFARSPAAALKAYAATTEPMDKAGAYAIQGHGARLVEKVDGCFYNVMGLPIQLTLRLLERYFDPLTPSGET